MSLINKEKTMEEIPIDVCDGFEVTDIIEKMPTVKAIPLDKIKQAREEIENLEVQIQSYHNDDPMISQSDVLGILDKLIEGVEG